METGCRERRVERSTARRGSGPPIPSAVVLCVLQPRRPGDATSAGEGDAFVLALTANGSPVWARALGGSGEDRRVRVSVRTAETLAGLEAAGENGWVEVVDCPDGPCEPPERPTDRILDDQGNVYAALADPAEAGHRYLEHEVELSAAGDRSPAFNLLDLCFFCTDEQLPARRTTSLGFRARASTNPLDMTMHLSND